MNETRMQCIFLWGQCTSTLQFFFTLPVVKKFFLPRRNEIIKRSTLMKLLSQWGLRSITFSFLFLFFFHLKYQLTKSQYLKVRSPYCMLSRRIHLSSQDCRRTSKWVARTLQAFLGMWILLDRKTPLLPTQVMHMLSTMQYTYIRIFPTYIHIKDHISTYLFHSEPYHPKMFHLPNLNLFLFYSIWF